MGMTLSKTIGHLFINDCVFLVYFCFLFSFFQSNGYHRTHVVLFFIFKMKNRYAILNSSVSKHTYSNSWKTIRMLAYWIDSWQQPATITFNFVFFCASKYKYYVFVCFFFSIDKRVAWSKFNFRKSIAIIIMMEGAHRYESEQRLLALSTIYFEFRFLCTAHTQHAYLSKMAIRDCMTQLF